MNPSIKIYITGGSGSGATSLGKSLEKKFGIKLFDTDDFFHKPTDPPFQEQYSKIERNSLLRESINPLNSWIVSGSVSTWEMENFNCTHAIFLNPGTDLRITRLKKRELERFGSRVETGGDMHTIHLEFIEWAKGYENNAGEGRTFKIELDFLKAIDKKLLMLDGDLCLKEILDSSIEFIK
ncbi:MAG: hypothetical protein HN576_00020 [Bacteriovoracaceae bacterium]|jgi:adenylate kinase family enzyme|nr:hypothetical protein [Bacteriovoracaceae bacterium]